MDSRKYDWLADFGGVEGKKELKGEVLLAGGGSLPSGFGRGVALCRFGFFHRSSI